MQAKYAENIILDAGYVVKPLFPLPLSPLEEEYIDLTLIIPVYNAEKYLPKCLQSVLNQETTYRYEVICIDDGSTDNSYDILKQYIHTYIHCASTHNPTEVSLLQETQALSMHMVHILALWIMMTMWISCMWRECFLPLFHKKPMLFK